MSGETLDEPAPVPDYELEQRFPERHDLSADDRDRLVERLPAHSSWKSPDSSVPWSTCSSSVSWSLPNMWMAEVTSW